MKNNTWLKVVGLITLVALVLIVNLVGSKEQNQVSEQEQSQEEEHKEQKNEELKNKEQENKEQENGEQTASSFNFTNLVATDFEGNPVTADIFSDYDATIINIWSTTCGPCIDEMPYLESISHEFKEQNINLIAIPNNISKNDETFEVAKNIIETQAVTFKNLRPTANSDFDLALIEEALGLPSTYIVDSNGEIIGNCIPGVLDDFKKGRIKEMINEALGSSIK